LEFVDLENVCSQLSRPRCFTDSALVLTPSGSELASPLETSEADDRSSLSESSESIDQAKLALPKCPSGDAGFSSPPASPWQGPAEWVPVDGMLASSCQHAALMPMLEDSGLDSYGFYDHYSFAFWPCDADMLPYILPHEVHQPNLSVQCDAQQQAHFDHFEHKFSVQQQEQQQRQQQQQQQQDTAFEEVSSASPDGSPEMPRTTVMIRNIPKMYSRHEVQELLDSEGFAGKYDFLYLPIDFKQGDNLGYAFVNLASSADAHELILQFTGFKLWPTSNEEVCEVSWSNQHQGLDQHIERYRNSPVMHENVPEEWKPLILAAGQAVPFPTPTKKIKSPRIRCVSLGAQ